VTEVETEASSARAYLEIRLGRGPVTRRALTEPRVVVGRSPSVELQLDHDTVSRRHAELSCDPFGRFWVRDLGSTNGTVVNTERVSERQLAPGDRIRVGDYTLVLHLPAPHVPTRPPLEADPLVSEETPEGPSTLIKILEDAEAPKISARHLSTLPTPPSASMPSASSRCTPTSEARSRSSSRSAT
jgi:pSer/pThr/pTyr-binding forkhead associated (FHA) protein